VSRASVAAVAVALALLAQAPAAAARKPAGPTRTEAWIARIVRPTAARNRPNGSIVRRVGVQGHWYGGPVGLLVLGSRIDSHGRRWLNVRLPGRPNRSSGWIRASVARLSRTGYRIVVSVGRRTVRLLDRGRLVHTYGAVVGKSVTPTPPGLFAVSERVPQPDPNGFLGPWALLLTAYSPTLRRFGGGPGQIALHGRDGASLNDPLGTARSHGCIRISNAGIDLLARVAREGTPVVVTR
jgi:lipoprotein-anchoring transpeptidase ErfK/SrfK